ncbi:MAG: FAD:protein FMN transferase [Planctomycetales bacterium]|nr:FAD:protein FMN transferase [Planctomycetales bacterium]
MKSCGADALDTHEAGIPGVSWRPRLTTRILFYTKCLLVVSIALGWEPADTAAAPPATTSAAAADSVPATATDSVKESSADSVAEGAVADAETLGYAFSFPALGTVVSFKAFHADRAVVQRGFERAAERVRELEAILTDYDPNSETRRLSQQAVGQPHQVSPDLWEVLAASQRWHQRTDGAFDSSLGTLTRLWRKHRRAARLPSEQEIQQALQQSGWQHVRLDAAQCTVELTSEDIQFDFGAIGKGYIADEAYELLRAADLSCCLVNISGNMRAGDAPPSRSGWRIEIAPLEKDGPPLRRVEIVQQAIATSGDLWQFSLIDGQRRSHILDPRTGYGVLGPRCATAIAPTATDADALATAACIGGFEQGRRWADSLPGGQLLVADKSTSETLRVQATEGFPES